MKNCFIQKYRFLMEQYKIYLIDFEQMMMMKIFLYLAYAVLTCIAIYLILLFSNILTLNIELLMGMFIIISFFFLGIYSFYNDFSKTAMNIYKILLKSLFKKINNCTENKEFNKDLNLYFEYYLGFLICHYNTLENQDMLEVRSYQKKMWTNHKKDKEQIMQYIMLLQNRIIYE